MTIFSNLMQAFRSNGQPLELTGTIKSSKIPKNNQEKGVHIYSHTWMGKKHLGTSFLDASNSFKHTIPASFSKSHKISLEIFETSRPFISHGLHGYYERKPLGKAFVKLNGKSEQNLTLTDKQIEALTHIDKPTGISRPSVAYFARLTSAGGPEIIKSGLVKISSSMTAEKVQRIFNSFGPQYARSEPTIPNLLNDLMNSICAIDYEKEGDKIKWVVNWDDYRFDKENSLPNVTVIANKEGDSVTIDSIHVQFRGKEERVIVPNQSSSDELKWAIYMARSCFALRGEAEIHLAEGHLLPGITAHSFLTSISKENPLYDITVRYLKNLEFINWLGGQGIIFGKDSIIELSALEDQSVAELIIRYMNKKADFVNYQPTEPISSSHHRAIVGKIHYETLLDYFTTFINDNWDKIVPYKKEIFQWSESMNQKLSSIPKIMPDPNQFLREEEGKRLALCLASLVNQTTFLHWASHSRQELLTHVDLASLSLSDEGRGPNGLPVKFGNTTKEIASLQLKIARTLLNFKAHRFVDYAHPDLLKKINQLRDKYLTFPLKEMFVSTEI